MPHALRIRGSMQHLNFDWPKISERRWNGSLSKTNLKRNIPLSIQWHNVFFSNIHTDVVCRNKKKEDVYFDPKKGGGNYAAKNRKKYPKFNFRQEEVCRAQLKISDRRKYTVTTKISEELLQIKFLCRMYVATEKSEEVSQI